MSFSSKAQAAFGTVAFVSSAFVSAAILGTTHPAAAQDRTELLSTDESSMMTGYLYKGESVYAICDQDCSDIDLYLYDEDGSAVYDEYGNMVSDMAADAFPVITAPYEGTYKIEAYMSACSTSICSISVSSDNGF